MNISSHAVHTISSVLVKCLMPWELCTYGTGCRQVIQSMDWAHYGRNASCFGRGIPNYCFVKGCTIDFTLATSDTASNTGC